MIGRKIPSQEKGLGCTHRPLFIAKILRSQTMGKGAGMQRAKYINGPFWEIATHSSFLAWRIPWTEEPDGLQSMGSQRVRLD